MTYSIVAHDPTTGRLGVAVQSHYLAVGPVVPWLEAGVGAVATQAFVEVGYGPVGLELLRNGRSATETVAALVAGDPLAEQRQVGVVDKEGRAAAHTGRETIPHAGHQVGEGYTVQGNLLHSDTCWPAMATTYERATRDGLPFSERLLLALEAAEGEGGDVRGRQSSAIVIVEGQLQAVAWRSRVLDVRVDDHPDPLGELRRIVNLAECYALLDDEGEAARAGRDEADRYAEARRRAPEAAELAFWMAVELAKRGEIEPARRELAVAIAADARWRTTLERLPAAKRLDPGLVRRLLDEV